MAALVDVEGNVIRNVILMLPPFLCGALLFHTEYPIKSSLVVKIHLGKKFSGVVSMAHCVLALLPLGLRGNDGKGSENNLAGVVITALGPLTFFVHSVHHS